jgi:hypothetical protein
VAYVPLLICRQVSRQVAAENYKEYVYVVKRIRICGKTQNCVFAGTNKLAEAT